jgi:hypothetical protein
MNSSACGRMGTGGVVRVGDLEQQLVLAHFRVQRPERPLARLHEEHVPVPGERDMHDGPVPGDVERSRPVADVTASVRGDVNPRWLRVLHPHLLRLQHRRLHAVALSERPGPRGIVGLQDVVLGHGLDLVAQRGLELVEPAAQFAESEQKGSVHVH